MVPLIPEAEWLAVLQDVPHWAPPMRPTVVIAPHPDDETLGAGGLIATQRRRGVPVIVVAVTNGEAAYPGARGLGEVRRAEQQLAVAELGVGCTELFSMHFPDGNVVAFEEALTHLVRPFVQPRTLLVAPWFLDLHPDHEACGRVAERMANFRYQSDLVCVLGLAPQPSRGTKRSSAVSIGIGRSNSGSPRGRSVPPPLAAGMGDWCSNSA